ncbi:permease [Floricoccus penangensis]|uniref:permease n=1 Tax=Floricoccus penangensis TaxID=1859475 RepID=UPI00203ACEBF|nr:permease [Floricoccus penangensis]URZ88523.1 permease [Floricoccus penangensis]
MQMLNNLPYGVLQCATIFMSIIIEALPFVLLGSIVSGFLEVFLTPQFINKILPKNKVLRIFFGVFLGFFFPSCECGIVPIVHRLMAKGIPGYTALPFMVAAPIVNPVVLFATYIAFGNSWRFALLRMFGAILIATIVGLFIAYIYKDDILREGDMEISHSHDHHHTHDANHKSSLGHRIWDALSHAIDEFFDTGRYLIIGSAIASIMQIYIPTRYITNISHNKLMAILLMMLLAFIMSLCSEADAFIGSSLLGLFGPAPVIAFLLFGPVVDIKNLLMMNRFFKPKFTLQFIAIVTLATIIFAEVFV